MTRKPLPAVLAIGGPTAVGKTALAVEVALRVGAELVNADSRQVARRLRSGTAAPSAADLRGVRCHLLDQVEPGEPFSVAAWAARARSQLDDLRSSGVPAIVVGGTGQYLRALRRGWDFGGHDAAEEQRARLTATAATRDGLDALVAELRARDPAAAQAMDVRNPRRVVRALEVLRASGATLQEARGSEGGWPITLVVVDVERVAHAAALQARMRRLFEGGEIIAETGAELARGTAPGALERAGIGYAEALDVLAGRSSVADASARALQRTRRYVKAQRTWFRHEPADLRAVHRGDAVHELADAVADLFRRAGSPL